MNKRRTICKQLQKPTKKVFGKQKLDTVIFADGTKIFNTISTEQAEIISQEDTIRC